MSNGEPRIENSRPLLVAGLCGHFTDASLGGIPVQWRRFGPYLGKIPGQTGGAAYGVCFNVANGVDYLSGVEVSTSSGLPTELICVSIPAQKYAVFHHHEHVSKLRNTLDRIWRDWLPASGHQASSTGAGAPCFFERYGETFDPVSGIGGVEVWVPIQS
jgi:AraC family transcriptional regulator